MFMTNREIDREEFKKVMSWMRSHNRQGAVHSDGLRAGHKLGDSAENGGLVEYFFGKDGKLRLQHDKFVQFLRDLRDEVCHILEIRKRLTWRSLSSQLIINYITLVNALSAYILIPISQLLSCTGINGLL